MNETIEGGCACGAVRYRATIEKREGYYCHCRMCQRASGNIALALMSVKQADHEWLSGPDWFESSEIARRPYCAQCGTSLGFQYREGSENMDLTIASLDKPYGFTPTSHFGAESIHEEWLNTTALPRHKANEYQPLVERWAKATGKAPE